MCEGGKHNCELVEALKRQTASMDAFTNAVAQLTIAISQMIDPGEDEDAVCTTYMDGTPIK